MKRVAEVVSRDKRAEDIIASGWAAVARASLMTRE